MTNHQIAKRCVLFVLLFCSICFVLAGASTADQIKICTVYLADGSIIRGELIRQNDDQVVVNTASGIITLNTSGIIRIEYQQPASLSPVPVPGPNTSSPVQTPQPVEPESNQQTPPQSETDSRSQTPEITPYYQSRPSAQSEDPGPRGGLRVFGLFPMQAIEKLDPAVGLEISIEPGAGNNKIFFRYAYAKGVYRQTVEYTDESGDTETTESETKFDDHLFFLGWGYLYHFSRNSEGEGTGFYLGGSIGPAYEYAKVDLTVEEIKIETDLSAFVFFIEPSLGYEINGFDISVGYTFPLGSKNTAGALTALLGYRW